MPESLKGASKQRRSLFYSLYFWLLLGGLATIVALLAYQHLPERRLPLTGEDVQAYIYADSENSVEFIDQKALKWRCLIERSYSNAFCGMHLVLGDDSHQGVDLTGFHSISLIMDYRGAAPWLRYYVRNREPGFSEQSDLQTHKFMQAHIATEFLEQGLLIGLDEFYVAEWWLAEYRVPRESSGPSFEHVSAFGVDLSYPVLEGEHVWQIHSAELVGNWISKEQWYGGIIAIWLGIWLLAGIGGLLHMRRSMHTERRRSHLYRELSQHDQLTGLLNRHGITVAIEQLFSHPDTVLSLLVLDIDHFKPLNDQYGHDVGDKVLAQLGQLLQNSVRQSDFAGRWGGEEFVILLPHTHRQAANTLAEKLRSQVAQLSLAAMDERNITVSIGLAEREPGESYNQLFKRADTALYCAKSRGRNQTVTAQPQSV